MLTAVISGRFVPVESDGVIPNLMKLTPME